MATQWGRKETVIWPPQVPIYTIGTMILAVPICLTLLFGLYITKPFLARNYTGDYLKSAAGSEFKMHNSFRLIYLFGGKAAPRVAQPEDFVPGTTIFPNGKQVSVQLSPAATAVMPVRLPLEVFICTATLLLVVVPLPSWPLPL